MRDPHSDIKKIFVTHVKQSHGWDSLNVKNNQFENIAFSQFNVAKAILANPKAIVVSESLKTNHTISELSEKHFISYVTEANKIFATGLPQNFTELSELQKKFLVDNGGDMTVFFLGKLPAIYKSIDEKLGDFAWALNGAIIPKKDYSVMFGFREDQAIYCFKEAALSIGEAEIEVLLVFGAAHDIENKIKLLNNKSIIFKRNINTLNSEGQLDLLQCKTHLVKDMLNNILGTSFTENYGHLWSPRLDKQAFSANLKLYLTLTEDEMSIIDEIKNKLNNCKFNVSYKFTKEKQDCGYHFFCLAIECADKLFPYVVGDSKQPPKFMQSNDFKNKGIRNNQASLATASPGTSFPHSENNTISNMRLYINNQNGLGLLFSKKYMIYNKELVNIDPALKEALIEGGIKDYLEIGLITLYKLIEIHQKTPWVISALRCKNIREGIEKKIITVDQLIQLTEVQTVSIKHEYYGQELKSKIEDLLGQHKTQNTM